MKFDPLKDYYQILHISKDADLDAIKRAYRARSMECHPDRGGSHQAMLDVIEAFKILADPETKRHYEAARSELFNQNAQAIIRADISHARQKAEEYPRKWNEFESWSKVLMSAGVELAKGSALILGRYVAGFAICIIGYIVANMFGIPDDGSSYGSIGLITVIIIGVGIWALRQNNPARAPTASSTRPSPHTNTTAAHIMFAQCRQCGQQLRVTWYGEPIKVRCPNCRFEFYFDPTSRP